MSESRFYRLFGDSELSKVCAKVQPAIDSWAQAWLLSGEGGSCKCLRPGEIRALHRPGASWRTCRGAGERWIGVRMSGALRGSLAASIFGDDRTTVSPVMASPLCGDVVLQALDRLAFALMDALGAAPASARPAAGEASDTPAAWLWQKGAGALVLQISVGETEFPALVSPAVLLDAIPLHSHGAPPLHPRLEPVLGQKLRLNIVAGHAEFELGILNTIRVGDVLRLDTRIDEPLHLEVAPGQPAGRAYLGTHDAHKAVLISSEQGSQP